MIMHKWRNLKRISQTVSVLSRSRTLTAKIISAMRPRWQISITASALRRQNKPKLNSKFSLTRSKLTHLERSAKKLSKQLKCRKSSATSRAWSSLNNSPRPFKKHSKTSRLRTLRVKSPMTALTRAIRKWCSDRYHTQYKFEKQLVRKTLIRTKLRTKHLLRSFDNIASTKRK